MFLVPVSAQEADEAYSYAVEEILNLPWQSYPSVGAIENIAEISLAGDIQFLDERNSSRFLELNENPPSSGYYIVAPSSTIWFAAFSFDQAGYVRDDETIDANELLQTLKEQNAIGIEERRDLGLPILRLAGWSVLPHYDEITNQLEWGTRILAEDGTELVNYTIRILGRSGVMSARLVSDPERLQEDIAEFRKALGGFTFVGGQTYAEYREGDRLAEYGLAALVVGGAAAVAASTGIFKVLGKFIMVIVLGGIAAVAVVFKAIANKITGRA